MSVLSYLTRRAHMYFFQEPNEVIPSLYIETLFYPQKEGLSFQEAFKKPLIGGEKSYKFKEWVYFYSVVHDKLIKTLDTIFGEIPYIMPEKDLKIAYLILKRTHEYIGKLKVKQIPYLSFDLIPTISGDMRQIQTDWLAGRGKHAHFSSVIHDTHLLYKEEIFPIPLRLRFVLEDVDRMLTEVIKKRNQSPKSTISDMLAPSPLPESIKLEGHKVIIGDKSIIFSGLRFTIIKLLVENQGTNIPVRKLAKSIKHDSKYTRIIIHQINKRLKDISSKINLSIGHDGQGNYHLSATE